MCWVAIERAIGLAIRRGLPADLERVNRQDLVMTAHPPGGEARFVAKGSHGHEGAPGNTRRSEPPVNPARFTYMSKKESGGIPNGITTRGRK
jgi:hypothetical protein